MLHPDVRVGLNTGQDPTFDAGSIHHYHLTLINPTDSQWTYDVMFCCWGELGAPGAECSHFTPTIPAGGSVTLEGAVLVPSIPGTYPCFADISANGYDLGRFNFPDITVVEAAVPEVEVTLSWD